MRNRLGGFLAAIAGVASFGCAPLGAMWLPEREDPFHFDTAAFAVLEDRAVLALSVETKQSWELLATTRDVWIVFPGELVEGRCEIGPAGCSLRYVRNLGLALGALCAAQAPTGRGTCEIPENLGLSAESGSITVEQLVEDERLEGSFDVITASGRMRGDFEARFDALAALELRRLLTPTP